MNRLQVYFHGTESGDKVALGELGYKSGLAYLELSNTAVDLALNLSPLQLRCGTGLQVAKPDPFQGLHGVFADSLPDGWGLLLMDRDLRRRGYSIESLTPLDRLAYVGNRAFGALTYRPVIDIGAGDVQLTLAQQAQQAIEILAGNASDVLEQLVIAGGSPGGARPKANIVRRGNEIVSGLLEAPAGYSHWLVKFPLSTSIDEQAAGHVEYVYAHMAQKAGIRMPEVDLLAGPGEFDYFAVQRFDRVGNKRLHCHSLAGLLHANFRLPDCDYETLLKATRHVTGSHEQATQAFRLMLFNILTGNRDDHSKNFSFRMLPDTDGGWEWELAPAYDLTFNTGINGEHSMSVMGHGSNIPREAVDQLGKMISLQQHQIQTIVDEVVESVTQWKSLSQEYGVPSMLQKTIARYIAQQVQRLNR